MNYEPFTSIENLTLSAAADLAHFRHFSSLFTNLPAYKAAVIYVPISHLSSACPVRVSFTLMGSSHLYICREVSTLVEKPLQISSFMQNKPNFQKSQMNVTPYNTTDYKNKSNWTLGENKPNSNPIKPNQTQSPKSQNERKIICYRGLQKKR